MNDLIEESEFYTIKSTVVPEYWKNKFPDKFVELQKSFEVIEVFNEKDIERQLKVLKKTIEEKEINEI